MQGRAQSPSVRSACPRRVAQTEQNRDCWIAIEQNGLSAMTTGPAVQSFALVWQQTWDAGAEPLRNVHIVFTLRATMSTRSDNVSLRVDAVLFGS